MQPGTSVLALAPGLSPHGTCCSLPYDFVSAAPFFGLAELCPAGYRRRGEKATGAWQQANLSQPLGKKESHGSMDGSPRDKLCRARH